MEISRCLLAPLGQRIGYLVHYSKNISELEKHIMKLDESKNTIIINKEEALCKGETINGPVEEWLRKVEEMESEVKKYDGVSEVNKRCFLDSRFFSRYKASKKTAKTKRAVCELLQDGNFDCISHMGPPPGIEKLPIGDFVAFTSNRFAINSIMEALNKSEVYIIGVHGMVGVGKTTIMNQVARKAKESKTFDDVVMVTVSQNQDLKKIQPEIA